MDSGLNTAGTSFVHISVVLVLSGLLKQYVSSKRGLKGDSDSYLYYEYDYYF
jgi:hypothetical protein